MKIALITGSIAALIFATFTVVANEVGKYVADVNPNAPEDYPRHDAGQDF